MSLISSARICQLTDVAAFTLYAAGNTLPTFRQPAPSLPDKYNAYATFYAMPIYKYIIILSAKTLVKRRRLFRKHAHYYARAIGQHVHVVMTLISLLRRYLRYCLITR